MEKIFEIKNLNVPLIYENFNLSANSGWTFVLGPSGSGKSIIVKNCAKIYKHDCEIYINGLELNNRTKKQIYNEIGILFENPDNLFFSDTVYDELFFSFSSASIPKNQIKGEIENISKKFGISVLLRRNIKELSGSEKQLIALIAVIAKNPKLIIIDDAFNRMTKSEKEATFTVLKELNTNIVYFSSNSNYSNIFDNIIIINHGEIILSGATEEVYKNDKIFTELGVEMPFMVDLSHKLMFYNLIDSFIYDMKEMVNKLWK